MLLYNSLQLLTIIYCEKTLFTHTSDEVHANTVSSAATVKINKELNIVSDQFVICSLLQTSWTETSDVFRLLK